MEFAGKRLRHELKFFIHHHEYIGLRNRIGTLLSLDRNSVDAEGYHIRSLYFDNMHESSLHDKMNGIFARKKYRVRIYNKSDATIKLERKSKYNDMVAKESASLTREQFELLRDGNYSFLKASGHPLMNDFYTDLVTGAMKPSVIVDYVREAYIYPTSDVRITFDKQLEASLQSFDIFDQDLVTAGTIEGPRTILEVKYDAFLPTMIRDLLQLSSHNRSSISKYGICKEKRKTFAQ
ncbi:polyphosphate polymerase domain-containing protein [Paenibacillus sp. MMS18-CY102]|uniref:polyphosphate polymerase domain-containing protein n=1 Tax=Paenibacillus sp. MMS18-CY102 TaxID=2682849 RepID=UPI001365D840|nr:polyphosphate polymerase domain-containing protein [Paenibacillus sp. MMS18-CY102]MWC30045.1 VTC domain-containing protein [Paenibacillus sp. MMS18-CY102]